MSTTLYGPEELDERQRPALAALLFGLADDEFVLAERYTEWQVRAPTLESDLALSNIAQDELGHARLWYDLLFEFGLTEEALLYDRDPTAFRHASLVELPFEDGDWADAIVRSYLYDVAEDLRLEALVDSSYPKIADRVGKIRREEEYHREHAENWLERLVASDEGRSRVQDAVDRLFPRALALFEPVELPGDPVPVDGPGWPASVTGTTHEETIVDAGFRDRSLSTLREEWLSIVIPRLESLDLEVPDAESLETWESPEAIELGRDGTHSDAWFDLYDEFTHTYHDLDFEEPQRIMDDPD